MTYYILESYLPVDPITLCNIILLKFSYFVIAGIEFNLFILTRAETNIPNIRILVRNETNEYSLLQFNGPHIYFFINKMRITDRFACY